MHSIQLRIRIDETLIPAARRAGEGCSPALIPHPPSGTKVRNQDFRNSRRRDFDADAYQPQSRAFGTRPRFSQPRFEAPSGPALHAAVKWFSPEKGFGFVELSDGSGDAFLHGSVLAQTGIGAVQPGETLEVRVGPGHKGPHVTEVLTVDSSTAVPMASRQSNTQATVPTGPSVEETGTVKWFNPRGATASSLLMTAEGMCLSTCRLLSGLALRGSAKGRLSLSM
jgi:cold shock CspA family protein